MSERSASIARTVFEPSAFRTTDLTTTASPRGSRGPRGNRRVLPFEGGATPGRSVRVSPCPSLGTTSLNAEAGRRTVDRLKTTLLLPTTATPRRTVDVVPRESRSTNVAVNVPRCAYVWDTTVFS